MKEEKPKKKKSVGFALEQNTVREFDKTKRIVETEANDLPSPGDQEKKSVQKENMDDLVSRTLKKKPTTTSDIAALSRSEVVTSAVQ